MTKPCLRCQKPTPVARAHAKPYCALCRATCPKCESRPKWRRAAYCQPCIRAYLKAYYARNKERLDARSREIAQMGRAG